MNPLTSKPLVILTGPTAVGKTEASIRLAKAINGEIISADSIQVYKMMDIGSAKITKEEMMGIPHHLIDIRYPDEDFNIFLFQKLAYEAMNDIYSRGKIPIIAGGTGFYIQSILYQIDFCEANDESSDIRRYYEELARQNGNAYLHKLLSEIDPKSASDIHENNVKRVIRALCYYKETGELISKHNAIQKEKESPFNFVYFVLNRERSVLYERINQRVDLMIRDGLVDEVRSLLKRGYDTNLVSMQGLGYKEIAAYIKGECSLNEAVDTIKRDTRHFAKRQLTWFRREKDVTMLNYEDYNNCVENLINKMIKIIKKKKII